MTGLASLLTLPLLQVLPGRLLAVSLAAALAILVIRRLARLAVPRWSPAAVTWLWWAVAAHLVVVLVAGLALTPVLPALQVPVPAGWADGWAGPVASATGSSDRSGPATDRRFGAVDEAASPALPTTGGSSLVRPRSELALGRTDASAPSFGWREIVGLGWLLGVVAGLVLAAARGRALGRRVAQAPPVDAPRPLALVDRLSERLGLARVPELRRSSVVGGPLVVAAPVTARPVIVVPEELVADEDRLPLVLAHELAHLARRDLALGWIPALARRLFFFHPLVRLAEREYALAREAACDAIALRLTGAAPADYGRMLVGLGTAPVGALGAGGRRSTLRRRLEMLVDTTRSASRTDVSPRRGARHRTVRFGQGLLASLALVAALGLALTPVQLVASPTVDPSPSPVPSSVPGTLGELSDSVPDSVPGTLGETVAAASGGVAADAGSALVPRLAAASELDSWVYLEEGEGSAHSHGSGRDGERARALRRGDEGLFWYRQAGREWVVRDAATLERIAALVEPLTAQAERMGRLGGEQGELGGRQAELGARQAEMGAEQARLAGEMAALAVEHAASAMASAAAAMDGDEEAARRAEEEAERFEREMAVREAEMERLGEEMGRKHEELARRQEELGRRQAELGRRQEALGRQLEEMNRRLTQELPEILEQARERGVVESVE